MFGARKRGLIRQKLETMFFSLFYFYLDPTVSLKQQKKSTFLTLAKVYAREMQKYREYFGSRKFLLLK